MKIPTIKQIIIRIIISIALVELAIMIVFFNTSFHLGPYEEAFLDVIILVVLSTPIIYLWIIKPYVVAHDEVNYQINHLAYHDPLTQLANRRLLLEYLEKQISSLVRHKLYGAIIFIDLDGFKIINDKNGHDTGDAILIEVAKRLKFLVRVEDVASRIGGDEFVVVLCQLDSDELIANNKALQVSERIIKELRKEINVENVTYQISASIGLRLLTPEEKGVKSALKDADTAMYRAKQAGKGCVVLFNK